MNKKITTFSMPTVMKWVAMFVMLFAISLPLAKDAKASNDKYTVSVDSGYLALRTEQAYDDRNEIGQLYPGDVVEVRDYSSSDYWWVYSPKHDRSGYVNCNYLLAGANSNAWTVRVNSGYLALRNAKAYDSRNEIGELYTGETVYVVNASDSSYWYVYSPKYGKYGYVNKDYLYGGKTTSSVSTGGKSYTVCVSSGYLALRNGKAYDYRNEIGELYTGDTVQLIDSSDATYWWVYSPKYNKNGYVNKNYLLGANSAMSRTVRVDSGYLALRTAKAYDDRNEIGELYTGDTVQLLNTSDPTYWYVYSPKYNTCGYVNCNYLTGGSSERWTVRVDSGYLALRTAKAYDERNEIGEMYTGETVHVISKDSGDYWYVYSDKLGKYGYTNKNYLY